MVMINDFILALFFRETAISEARKCVEIIRSGFSLTRNSTNLWVLSLFKNEAMGLENGRSRYVDPPAAQAAYKRRLTTHLDRVGAICRSLGIDYHLFTTDRPFDLALLDFLQDRMHRRKRIRRKGGFIGGTNA